LELEVGAARRLLTPGGMEELARSYWTFLRRRSGGLIRVVYGPRSRQVTLLGVRQLSLLRFGAPEYELEAGYGSVTWRIERGLLVARAGRGQGHLQIRLQREAVGGGDDGGAGGGGAGRERFRLVAEVENYYPLLRGAAGSADAARGGFARLAAERAGAAVYAQTQLRAHVWITRGFLRSVPRLAESLPPRP